MNLGKEKKISWNIADQLIFYHLALMLACLLLAVYTAFVDSVIAKYPYKSDARPPHLPDVPPRSYPRAHSQNQFPFIPCYYCCMHSIMGGIHNSPLFSPME